MRAQTDGLEPAARKLLDDVAEYGVHIVHVPRDDGRPGYSFSVGLWHSFGQPEVVVFGLPNEVAHELLNLVADEADDGRRFLGDSRCDGLLHGYPVHFVDVPRRCYHDYLGLASWAYESDEFPAVQLVWPDKQGRWPWDATTRQGFRDEQPVLRDLGATA
jgi:hypothetical protein